jgi:hypothetical protein
MGAGNQFWSSNLLDPKRSFRWILVLGPTQLPSFVIKSTAKPGFTITNVTHNYISHAFNFPGRITWEPLEVTLVDPVYPDASATLVKILQASGYTVPGDPAMSEYSFSKKQATDALGNPTIMQLDANSNPIDQWTLRNAWIENVKFGSLDYTTEDMVNVTLSFRYDWAEYSGSPATEGAELVRIMEQGMPQKLTMENYQKEFDPTAGDLTV